MQIETTMRYHFTPTRVAKIKNLTTLNVDKNVEQLELSYIVGVNWYNHFGKLESSYNVKLYIHLLPSHSTPR